MTPRNVEMGTRVFVGGLTHGVRERDLERFFHKCGRIKEVSMKNGFAFVEFYDYRDADDAVYKLNGKDLLGERVSVEIARGTPRGSDQYKYGYGGGGGGGRGFSGYGPPPTRTEHRLIVKNLSSRVTWQILKYYMGQAGEVTFADAHKKARNEGIVEFGSYSDMKNAMNKLDDSELKGRRIRLVEDKRRGGGGGFGGSRRSRSSSRSRSPVRRSRSRSRHRSHSSRSKSRGRSNSKSSVHSRSKSKDRERDQSKSRSRSPPRRSKSSSRSRGESPKERDK